LLFTARISMIENNPLSGYESLIAEGEGISWDTVL
jgi:hypothetical protein